MSVRLVDDCLYHRLQIYQTDFREVVGRLRQLFVQHMHVFAGPGEVWDRRGCEQVRTMPERQLFHWLINYLSRLVGRLDKPESVEDSSSRVGLEKMQRRAH